MSSNNHIIIFSHGFGARKDARGFFTEIASVIPNADPVFFDYNIIDTNENTLTVRTLSEQSKILGKVIGETKQSHPEATIDLVCHSQGCLVAGLLNPTGIRKTVFLAPPMEPGSSASLAYFAKRPGSEINPEGISRLVRADGSITLVPAEFWKERESILPIPLYNELAKNTGLVIIHANQDEVLGEAEPVGLDSRIIVRHIDGGHNFSGPDRPALLDVLKTLLN